MSEIFLFFYLKKNVLFINCGFSVTTIFRIYAAEKMKISIISLIIIPSLKGTYSDMSFYFLNGAPLETTWSPFKSI